MRIEILLWVIVVVVYVRSAPHHDGLSDGHTHAPVIVPDSESIVVADDHKLLVTNHSDLIVGNFTEINHSKLSEVVDESVHSDVSKIPNIDSSTSDVRFESVGSTEPPTNIENESVKLTTTKSKAVSKFSTRERSGPVAPVAPVHHPSSVKNEEDKKRKSVVAHAPVAPDSESTFESVPFVNYHSPGSYKIGSVVAHGPMAKNVEEKKHGHDHHRHHEKQHSTIHHAPMATDHHPPKTSNAHHPLLSKNEHVSYGTHARFAGHCTTPENKENDGKEETSSISATEKVHNESILINSDVQLSSPHGPMVAEHHSSKDLQANPLVSSKIEPTPTSGHHAPFAIPKSNHHHEQTIPSESTIGNIKTQESILDDKTITNSTVSEHDSPKPTHVNHPSISKY